MSGVTFRRFTRISPALATVLALAAAAPALADSPIVHRVSVGGPDICQAIGAHPGCNANFSLEAMEFEDGSVTGQYIDRLSHSDGFHAVINCLVVDGNTAWVSGIVVEGTWGGVDQKGRPLVARVQDNGTSARDAADKISYTWIGDARPCTMKLNYGLFAITQGQVSVK